MSGNQTVAGNLVAGVNVYAVGNHYSRGGYYCIGGSDFNAIQGTDGYLRLNQSSQFSNGVYTPGAFRVDGGLVSGAVSSNGAGTLNASGGGAFGGNLTVAGNVGIGTTTPVGTALLTVNGYIASSGYYSTPITVASLPSAATAGSGSRYFVNNALAPVFGSTVAGGGAVNVPVYSDGANWKVG